LQLDYIILVTLVTITLESCHASETQTAILQIVDQPAVQNVDCHSLTSLIDLKIV